MAKRNATNGAKKFFGVTIPQPEDTMQTTTTEATGEQTEGAVAPETKAKRTLVSFKDVLLTLKIGGGIPAVEAQIESGLVGKVQLFRALKELEQSNDSMAADVSALFSRNFKEQQAKRGREAPQVGKTRTYKAQQVGEDGDVFIRLPVELLGIVKGQNVMVTFEQGRMMVEAAPKSEVPQPVDGEDVDLSDATETAEAVEAVA